MPRPRPRPTAILALAAMLGAGSVRAGAQRPDSARTAVIEGTVYDSVARVPAAGAVVRLTSLDSAGAAPVEVAADATGRFRSPPLTPGAYAIGFTTPWLDSLDMGVPAGRVDAPAGIRSWAALAVPPGERIRTSVCSAAVARGAATGGDSTGLVVGRLRDAATDRPVAGGKVVVRWSELTISKQGVARSLPSISATTAVNGWFAICDVPIESEVTLEAIRGADSSGEITILVPANRLFHRVLFVDSSHAVAVRAPDSVATGDSIRLEPAPVRRGTGVVAGTVHLAGSQLPLRGARVTIVGSGVSVATDANGRFSLAGVPGGTQVLETRALGYLADRRLVDLVAGRTPEVRVALSNLEHYLDTVRVTARRIYSVDENGFEQRRRLGFGKYFAREEIDRYRPFHATDLLHLVPSVHVVPDPPFDRRIVMRGATSYCTPTVFVDGLRVEDATADDVDNWVRPDEIAGMEVYTSAAQVPAEFSTFKDCGAVLIWTRRGSVRR